VVQALDRPSLEARGPLGRASFLNLEDSGPRWIELVKKGGSALVGWGLPTTMVIMAIRLVLVEEFLARDQWVGDQYSRASLSGACGCLWLRPIMSDPKWCDFPITQWSWCLPNMGEPRVMRRARKYQLGDKILSAHDRGGRPDTIRS
jgi:hypothetical protein